MNLDKSRALKQDEKNSQFFISLLEKFAYHERDKVLANLSLYEPDIRFISHISKHFPVHPELSNLLPHHDHPNVLDELYIVYNVNPNTTCVTSG